ncbi:MAG: DUF6672 family protein [Cetobacterium sp.]|uniref:DUF6672 family protein n=1 Tax=Cetobacterium sp. ZOR0034 TaxID=1339239 RepID=UPI000647C19D|nr:DUF6672 family protein [Cetobacterium sp. ZOR0034]
MRRIVVLISFFFSLVLISYFLYVSGQEHTLIFNNIYKDKAESKNIVLKIAGEKDKKISKNRKTVIELKGKQHKFIIESDGQIKEGIVKFSLNKGAEVEIENFMKSENSWIKEIEQY